MSCGSKRIGVKKALVFYTGGLSIGYLGNHGAAGTCFNANLLPGARCRRVLMCDSIIQLQEKSVENITLATIWLVPITLLEVMAAHNFKKDKAVIRSRKKN